MPVILGQINASGEAMVRLQIRAVGGHIFLVDALIDTGFGGAVALPESLMLSLGLNSSAKGSVVLADGSVFTHAIFRVEVEWNSAWSEIDVVALGDMPLVGCDLLRGYEVRIEFQNAGAVEIQKL